MEKSILDELFEAKCDNFEEERMKKKRGVMINIIVAWKNRGNCRTCTRN